MGRHSQVMMKLACMVLLAAFVFSSAAVDRISPSRGQLVDRMMAWFPGEFDNYDQLEDLALAGVAETHSKLHSIFYEANLTSFGDAVLYVQQTQDGDPTKVYRQRLYVFAEKCIPGTSECAVTMDIWQFKDPASVLNAHKHPKVLKDLSPKSDKVSQIVGCSVDWAWIQPLQQFNGTTGTNCTAHIKDFPLPGDHEYLITDHNVLNQDQVWIQEQWFKYDNSTQGPKVLGNNIPDKLTRSQEIRKFVGWIAYENPREVGGYSLMENITLYDSGQSVRVVDTNHSALPVTVELAVCSYSDKPPPILKIAVYKDGESILPGNATSYAWASPGALEVGINLRWIQGGFKIAPEAIENAASQVFYTDLMRNTVKGD